MHCSYSDSYSDSNKIYIYTRNNFVVLHNEGKNDIMNENEFMIYDYTKKREKWRKITYKKMFYNFVNSFGAVEKAQEL